MRALSFHAVAAMLIVGFFAAAGLRAADDAAQDKDAAKVSGDLKKLAARTASSARAVAVLQAITTCLGS